MIQTWLFIQYKVLFEVNANSNIEPTVTVRLTNNDDNNLVYFDSDEEDDTPMNECVLDNHDTRSYNTETLPHIYPQLKKISDSKVLN